MNKFIVKPAKSCRAWAVINKKTRKISPNDIYADEDVHLEKNEELIKVVITEWMKDSKNS